MKTNLRPVLLIALLACFFPGLNAQADPPILPVDDLDSIFCLRITEIAEEGPDQFTFTFEILNWTNSPAAGLYMAQADTGIGSPGPQPGGPFIDGIGIDQNGGTLFSGGIPSEPSQGIGPGFGIDGEHHSGRGTAVQPGFLNDWSTLGSTATSAEWDGAGGTAVPNRDLIGAFNSGGGNNLDAAKMLVPGFGTDILGDSAIDGGPSSEGPGTQYFGGDPLEAGEPDPFGSGNVLDGFTLTISDFDEGEVIALNWFLLDAAGEALGTAGAGNEFGFGVLNLFVVSSELGLDEGAGEAQGPGGPELPGPVFFGQTGSNQDSSLFGAPALPTFGFGTAFSGEIGGGITAPFLDPMDNTVGAGINTSVIPEPSRALLLLLGVIGLVARRRR